MPVFGAPQPKRHQSTTLVPRGVNVPSEVVVSTIPSLTESDISSQHQHARLGAMLRYRDDAVQESLPPIRNQVFDLATWKQQRSIGNVGGGGHTTAASTSSPHGRSMMSASNNQSVRVAGSRLGGGLSHHVTPLGVSSSPPPPRALVGITVDEAAATPQPTPEKLYYEPYVSSTTTSEVGGGDDGQQRLLSSGTEVEGVGGRDTNDDSTSLQHQQQFHRRPVSKGGASSNRSRSRPGSPSACSFVSAKNTHLVALSADAQDYYNGNYLLSVPSEILAGKHEAPLSRPTNRTTHDIIHNFKPNANGNTTTIQALEMAAVRFVEERYKPSRSGLYSDIPSTATHFLSRDAIGSDDKSLITQQKQQQQHGSINNNNSDVSSLSFNSNVGAATQAMPTALVPMRKKVTRDRLRTWRSEGGAMSWASEGQVTNSNNCDAEEKVKLLTAHSQASQRSNYSQPSFSPSTTATLPLLYNHDYKELRREAEILAEEQEIRGELYEGKKRDFTRRLQFVGAVMSGMEKGDFLQPPDTSLLQPTHDDVQVQLRQTLRREEVPVMFVRHEEDYPPGYFGESSSDNEESEDD